MVDKPTGPTSHDVVASVRRAIGIRRVGHTGTLDPFASGLLVLLVGHATRLARFLVGQDKRYSGIIHLGTTTDSYDRTGTVTGTDHAWTALTQGEIKDAMATFIGSQFQRPPDYSAKKIAGERSYRLARNGRPVDLDECEVEISSFVLTAMDGPNLMFEALVSSGTYVRALARDLGELLGCGAHLSELRRTVVGPFDVADALHPSAVEPDSVCPSRDAVRHLQSVTVNQTECEFLRSGRPIPLPNTLAGCVAVLSGDELVAVAEARGVQLQPRVVFP